MGGMACDSPLRNDISSELSPAIQQALDKISKANEASNVSISEMLRQSEPDSLVAVQTFETAQAISNQHEYQQHVVAYAETWEVVVTNTVEVLTKTVRKLQGDRDHYEKKVFGLRKQFNTLEAKGRSSPARAIVRLERNEAKLKEAFVKYETEACRLCSLIEAVTRQSWMELQALCRNYIKWESNRGLSSNSWSFFVQCMHSLLTSFLLAAQRQLDGNLTHIPIFRVSWNR
jgi:hypothetical protein